MSRAKWILLIVVVLLVAIQLYRPAISNPPVDRGRTIQALVPMPPQVDSILHRSCYDCHSNEVRLPWYSKVAPVSWLIADDINDGRKEVNFSDWARLDQRRATRKMKEIAEQMQEKEMPLWYYLPLHPGAKVSDADRQLVISWARAQQARLGGVAARPAREIHEVARSRGHEVTR